jgi:hypothetical protein
LPTAFHRQIDEPLHVGVIPNITGESGNVSASLLVNLLRRLGRVLLVARAEKNVRTLTRQLARTSETDPATRGRYNRYFVFET